MRGRPPMQAEGVRARMPRPTLGCASWPHCRHHAQQPPGLTRTAGRVRFPAEWSWWRWGRSRYRATIRWPIEPALASADNGGDGFFAVLHYWDSNYYLAIAAEGYFPTTRHRDWRGSSQVIRSRRVACPTVGHPEFAVHPRRTGRV